MHNALIVQFYLFYTLKVNKIGAMNELLQIYVINANYQGDQRQGKSGKVREKNQGFYAVWRLVTLTMKYHISHPCLIILDGSIQTFRAKKMKKYIVVYISNTGKLSIQNIDFIFFLFL